MTAYMLFTADQRPKVIAQHPELKSKVAEVAKHIGAKWHTISAAEKAKFEEKAAAAKAEYEALYGKVTRAKKEGAGKKAKDPNAPKRGPSGYMIFSNETRAKVIAEQPELKSKVTDVAKIIGAKWQALSDAEKAKYNAKAQKA
jgi:DNA-binding XRE family transcriptional regulator